MKERRLVAVLGTARSGTLYTTRVLRAAGLDVRHESVGSAGSVSCFLAADTPPPAEATAYKTGAKHADGSTFHTFEWDHVLHQVRDPLKIVASVEKTTSRDDRIWMGPILDLDPKMPKLAWSVEYVLSWSRLVKLRNPKLRYRVEDLPTVWPSLLRLLSLPQIPMPDVARNTRIHASTGFRKAKTYTYHDLQCATFAAKYLYDLAEEWGYEPRK